MLHHAAIVHFQSSVLFWHFDWATHNYYIIIYTEWCHHYIGVQTNNQFTIQFNSKPTHVCSYSIKSKLTNYRYALSIIVSGMSHCRTRSVSSTMNLSLSLFLWPNVCSSIILIQFAQDDVQIVSFAAECRQTPVRLQSIWDVLSTTIHPHRQAHNNNKKQTGEKRIYMYIYIYI